MHTKVSCCDVSQLTISDIITMNNSTARNETGITGNSWSTTLAVLEAVSISLLCLAIWVLLSVIIYGIKTRRWRKRPNSSSLTTGKIYIACTAAVCVLILRLMVTEMSYVLPRLKTKQDQCNTVCAVDNIMYIAAVSASYCFLWLMQRIIYTHPYVKPKIPKSSDIISRAYILFFTLITVGIACAYGLLNFYVMGSQGCVLKSAADQDFLQGNGKNLIFAGAILLLQGVLFFLCLYPAIRVKFDGQKKIDEGVGEREIGRNTLTRGNIGEFLTSSADTATSPIEMAVRRTLRSCIIMMVTDVIALSVASLVIPTNAPVAMRQTIYDIGAFANVFCMLSSLGFAGKVLTLCCPKCTTRRLRTRSLTMRRTIRDRAPNTVSDKVEADAPNTVIEILEANAPNTVDKIVEADS